MALVALTQPCDYLIGSLRFNKAPTKDTPEERATAQFRKDQFDTQSNVGDQSLSGWWTRGQLSFHKGAGVTYYEVLDSETVLNRYRDSSSVVTMVPGEVTLGPVLDDKSVAATDAVAAPLGAGGGCYALTATGLVYVSADGSEAIDTSDFGVPYSICSDGDRYYVANGTLLEVQSASPAQRINYVANGNFEYPPNGIIGWTYGGGSGNAVQDSSIKRFGNNSIQKPDDSGTGAHVETTVSGLTVSDSYVGGAWVHCEGASSDYELSIAGVVVDSLAGAAAGWHQLRGTFTAGATSVALRVERTGGTLFAPFNTDAVFVTEAPYSGDYFDGSLPGCVWNGTPFNSTSTFVTPGLDPSTVLWTSTDSTWSRVFYAKGRLFAVDAEGYWYELSPAGGTVAQTDAWWNSNRANVDWSLTDSPSAVYVSDGHSIYGVTIDADGLVPELATPTTVFQSPVGETISSIAYYLGHVVITTTSGVRLGLVQSDASLLVGPLVIKGDFSANVRIGAHDSRAHVAGRLDGLSGATALCSIDLAQEVEPLVFAWTQEAMVTDTSSAATGAVVDGTGRLWTWADETLFGALADDKASEGYLTTGFHRFGTLDTKYFSSVLVRTDGAGGNVEVFRVDGSGTETSLGTVAAGASAELDLALSTPTERVAVKFVLSRDESDSTKGPTLLGYQLKALPLPKRQRMIRVPLLLFDYEVDGATRTRRGSKGGAWDRLAQLEALEESNAVVTFSDTETGESGVAYIEALEVKRTSPVGTTGEGFGGTLWVTLRKL